MTKFEGTQAIKSDFSEDSNRKIRKNLTMAVRHLIAMLIEIKNMLFSLYQSIIRYLNIYLIYLNESSKTTYLDRSS